jgi:hypothetical protein
VEEEEEEKLELQLEDDVLGIMGFLDDGEDEEGNPQAPKTTRRRAPTGRCGCGRGALWRSS